MVETFLRFVSECTKNRTNSPPHTMFALLYKFASGDSFGEDHAVNVSGTIPDEVNFGGNLWVTRRNARRLQPPRSSARPPAARGPGRSRSRAAPLAKHAPLCAAAAFPRETQPRGRRRWRGSSCAGRRALMHVCAGSRVCLVQHVPREQFGRDDSGQRLHHVCRR